MPLIQRAVKDALTATGHDANVSSATIMTPRFRTDSVQGDETFVDDVTMLSAIPHFTPMEDEKEIALKEAADAIEQVKKTDRAVELTPRRAFLRRLQHQMIEEHQLLSFSVGDEPNRRLRIVPADDDEA
jgi:hypothetical protein